MNNRSNNLFKNETQRYALVGMITGLLFPVTATLIRISLSEMPFRLSSAAHFHLTDPLMWIIDTAPVILGFIASIAGNRQDNLQKLLSELRIREAELANTQTMLESRVEERTRALERRTLELETISDVVREISIIRNMDTLFNVTVNLIRERFKSYHTGIYLLDERGEYLMLQAASSVSAQAMLDQGFRLKISDLGSLGTALKAGQAYISRDITKDLVLERNPLLPETISEIILPIRLNNITIGTLDIQSDQPAAFDERDIQMLRLLTDQLAAAIENAQLVQQVEGTVRELNSANRYQTQKAWRFDLEERAASAYEYDGQKIRQIPRNLPEALMAQLENGKIVVTNRKWEQGKRDGETKNTLLVPLMVLNQLIGVIGLEQENPNHSWTDEEVAIAQAAANRAALTLENARLLEESQRRAYKERTISEATARIGAALNVENILDITAEELERTLGHSEVILQINTESRHSKTKMVSG